MSPTSTPSGPIKIVIPLKHVQDLQPQSSESSESEDYADESPYSPDESPSSPKSPMPSTPQLPQSISLSLLNACLCYKERTLKDREKRPIKFTRSQDFNDGSMIVPVQ